MIIYSEITTNVLSSGQSSGNMYIANTNIGDFNLNSGVGAMSLDGLFVPYTFYSSTLPQYSNTFFTKRLNPFNSVLNHQQDGNAFLPNAKLSDSGAFFKHKNNDQQHLYLPSIIKGSGDFQPEKQFFLNSGVDYSLAGGIALKTPFIMAGWGGNFNGQGNIQNYDPLPQRLTVPDFPQILNMSNYKVGPLDIRWDNLRGVWRFKEEYKLSAKPYESRENSVLNPGLPVTSSCSLFNYTYTNYYFPLSINGYEFDIVFAYSGGCTWTAPSVDISTEKNKKHLLSPLLTMSARTDNGRKFFAININFNTSLNETSDSNFDVDYLNVVPFNPTESIPLYVIDCPRLWKGISGSVLSPYPSPIGIFNNPIGVDVVIGLPVTGSSTVGLDEMFTVFHATTRTNYSSVISGIYYYPIKNWDGTLNFGFSPSGDYIGYISGILNTNTTTFQLDVSIVKRSGVVPYSTGILSYSHNYSTSGLPFISHNYYNTGIDTAYFGYAIYNI